MTTPQPRGFMPGPRPREIGADSTQTRALRPGNVDAEGGGTAPHPLGGGMGWTRPRPNLAGKAARMRVHQPGSHLLAGARRPACGDWSWTETRRRFSTLAPARRPVPGRAILSVLTLLLATAIALAPPFLAKFALDDAMNGDAGGQLYLIVALFLFAGLANWGMTYVQTYLTGWVGERMLADLRTTALRSPSAAVARLLRAEPGRRDHQPADERRRGARPARHGRRLDASSRAR